MIKDQIENAYHRQLQHENLDENESKQKYINVQLRTNAATGIPALRIPWRHCGEKNTHRVVEGDAECFAQNGIGGQCPKHGYVDPSSLQCKELLSEQGEITTQARSGIYQKTNARQASG